MMPILQVSRHAAYPLGFWLILGSLVWADQQDETVQQGFKIDRSGIDSPQWQAMIALIDQSPSRKSGHSQLTLMRVIAKKTNQEQELQLTGGSLALPGKSGSGMYQQVRSGDFVLVQHINSSRRQDGRDPVEIAATKHYRANVWVDVPTPGTLGVLGDVILSSVPKKQMGRIVATIRSEVETPLNVIEFRFGPIVVGGPYGESTPFDSEGICRTGRIAPGEYKILLPGFDVTKSRWTVKVSPGHETRLELVTKSEKQVDLISESLTPNSKASPKKHRRATAQGILGSVAPQ